MWNLWVVFMGEVVIKSCFRFNSICIYFGDFLVLGVNGINFILGDIIFDVEIERFIK